MHSERSSRAPRLRTGDQMHVALLDAPVQGELVDPAAQDAPLAEFHRGNRNVLGPVRCSLVVLFGRRPPHILEESKRASGVGCDGYHSLRPLYHLGRLMASPTLRTGEAMVCSGQGILQVTGAFRFSKKMRNNRFAIQNKKMLQLSNNIDGKSRSQRSFEERPHTGLTSHRELTHRVEGIRGISRKENNNAYVSRTHRSWC